MLKKYLLAKVFVFTACFASFAYRIEEGDYFLGGGFGANVNVVRYNVENKATPKAELPILVNFDYAFLKDIGFFSSFMPHFGAGSIAFAFRGGAKYWFSSLDAPYVPYVSLALSPSFLFPMTNAPTHFNLGLSPGAGINFFVLSKFLIGAHIHFNPSVAFIDGDRKFEFSVMSFFDVSLRV